MVPCSRNASGLRTRYILADPPCVHSEGLTCACQKLEPCFCRGDAAARAVIGLAVIGEGSRLRRSVCVVIALCERGTVIGE